MNPAVAATPLEIRRLIGATITETWRAWTNPELMSRWFAPGPLQAEVTELDVRKGGRYRINMAGGEGNHVVVGRFLDVKPENRIVMTWAWEGDDSGESTVSVSFTSVEGGTELHIVHEGLPDPESAGRHSEGWAGCLAKLESGIASF